MELTFPIFVQSVKRPGKESIYRARFLFSQQIVAEDQILQRAIKRLERSGRKFADQLGTQMHHDALGALAYSPDIESRKLKFQIDMRDRMARVNYFLAIFQSLDRTIAFNPLLPDVWFEIVGDDKLESRALEVYQQHFRRLKRESGYQAPRPEEFSVQGECWVTNIDINVRTDQVSSDDNARRRASLWSDETMHGAVELERTGRCLDVLYPDDLESAIGREQEIDELEKLLDSRDRRPVLLVGESMVGKTAIIHEVVRRRVEKRGKKKKGKHKKNIWLLSPQRLISGMSYVGQWENRIQAILKEAEKRQHVIYFDDLVGLFRAGQTSNSNLSIADLLKHAMNSRSVRVLGEATPSAFDRMASHDRQFTDEFHVLRIKETDARTTFLIAIDVAREMKHRQRCSISFEALQLAIQLQRRYVRASSFPGKAARFLRQLAVKYSGKSVNQANVLQEFRSTTGIVLSLLADRSLLKSETVRKFFDEHIVGQETAVQACIDMISVTKARLNAPDKPLSTMLFLGPTGVGKTECAKALCKFLFGSADRLIRFDLNEFKSPYSAARLVGTFNEPEGLLTGAVRQQPYCVILLDEIEKAHPDVFDILLQVTGEGRLSDAVGRTSDFTNAVIIMTSNLGTSGGKEIGFGESDPSRRYTSAARNFFRPEFYNRIDRVIPFQPLSREQIGRIAQMMMQQVVSREGLVRRRCILQVEPESLSKVVAAGYHKELGARAMKRAIEEHFTQPVSDRLAAIRSDLPTIIRLHGDGGATGFVVDVTPLENVDVVDRPAELADTIWLIEHVNQFLDRVRTEFLADRPTGSLVAGAVSNEVLRYFAIDEQVNQIEEQIRVLQDRQLQKKEEANQPVLPVSGERKRKMKRKRWSERINERRILKEINSVRDIKHFVDETVQVLADSVLEMDPANLELANQCALLHEMTKSGSDQVQFTLRSIGGDFANYHGNTLNSMCGVMKARYQNLFTELGYNVDFVEKSTDRERCFVWNVSGSFASAVLRHEIGCQLACYESGRLALLKTEMVNLLPGDKSSEPDLNGPDHNRVLRMFDFRNRLIDFRTGAVLQIESAGKEQFLDTILRGLPLPIELLRRQGNGSD